MDTLVEKVTIDQDRTLHVHIRINLLRILEDDANTGGSIESAVSTEKVGIYTRKPAGRKYYATSLTSSSPSDDTAKPLPNAWTGYSRPQLNPL